MECNRNCCCNCCYPSILAINDPEIKKVEGHTALIFTEPALLQTRPFDYQPGYAEIDIAQAGVYQLWFQCLIKLNDCAVIPSEVKMQVYLNGNPIDGSQITRTFTSSFEEANLSESLPFKSEGSPFFLVIYVESGNFTILKSSLTIMKLS